MLTNIQRCSAELTIKTDPKNSDYQCEWGASRNFEPWRENKKIEEQAKEAREKEELGDAMKVWQMAGMGIRVSVGMGYFH